MTPLRLHMIYMSYLDCLHLYLYNLSRTLQYSTVPGTRSTYCTVPGVFCKILSVQYSTSCCRPSSTTVQYCIFCRHFFSIFFRYILVHEKDFSTRLSALSMYQTCGSLAWTRPAFRAGEWRACSAPSSSTQPT